MEPVPAWNDGGLHVALEDGGRRPSKKGGVVPPHSKAGEAPAVVPAVSARHGCSRSHRAFSVDTLRRPRYPGGTSARARESIPAIGS